MLRDEKGQATIEAAFVLPFALVLVLLLVQPGILLYDRIVMKAAASEGCRLLATNSDSFAASEAEDYIKRRLGAVPQQDCFHVHSPECSWEIQLSGNEATKDTSVTITNEVKPLPLFDAGALFLGLLNERGNFELEVHVSSQTQPSWTEQVLSGESPRAAVGAWLHEN